MSRWGWRQDGHIVVRADGAGGRAVASIPRLSPSMPDVATKAKGEATSRGARTSSCQGMIEAGNENEGNHFAVDWEGPDDPNNPKKSGLPMGSHRALYVKLTSFSLQLDVPQEMGRDRIGIRLHFPEPRLIRHDRTSRTRNRSRVSYNELR